MWGEFSFIDIFNKQSSTKPITPSYTSFIKNKPVLSNQPDITPYLLSRELSVFEKSRYLELNEEIQYLINGYHTLPQERQQKKELLQAFNFLVECSDLKDLKRSVDAIVQFNDCVIRSHINASSNQFVLSYKQTPITRIPDSIIHDRTLKSYWFNLELFCIGQAWINSVPKSFLSQLGQCTHFVFRSCRFMSPPDFSDCSACKSLTLVDCGLFTIPDYWLTLPWVQSINLSSNVIATLPSSASESLKQIDLSSNRIHELPLVPPVPQLFLEDNCLEGIPAAYEGHLLGKTPETISPQSIKMCLQSQRANNSSCVIC